MSLKEIIKQYAVRLGFDLVGVTTAEPIDTGLQQFFADWLAGGNAAGMGYLHRNQDKRFCPAKLLDNAQSVICVAVNYTPPQTAQPACGCLRVANFALYEDYHEFIRRRLYQLADFIAVQQPNIQFKVCVDSVPLAERALAHRAGLGFIGKNRLLIHPTLGGQLLLGELLTTLPLEPDSPLQDNPCGDCRCCIQACPTGALTDKGLDCRRCLSYLTIEEPGDIPAAFHSAIGNRLFGCDACLLACPYSQNAPACSNSQFALLPRRNELTAVQVAGWTQADFEAVFGGSAVGRLGLDRLRRNARICGQNHPRQTQ